MTSNLDIVLLLRDCDSDVAALVIEELAYSSEFELRALTALLIKDGSQFIHIAISALMDRTSDKNPFTHQWLLDALIDADMVYSTTVVLGDYVMSREDLGPDAEEEFLRQLADFLQDAVDANAWNVLRGVRLLDRSMTDAYADSLREQDTADVIAAGDSYEELVRILSLVADAEVFYLALQKCGERDVSTQAELFADNAGDLEAYRLASQMVRLGDYVHLRRISRLVGLLSQEHQEQLFREVVELDSGPMMAALLENADWKTSLDLGIQYAVRSKNALREIYDVYPIQTLRAIGSRPDFAALAAAVGPDATETIETCTRVSVFVYFAERALRRGERLDGFIAQFHTRVECSRRIVLEFMLALASPVAAAYLEWDLGTISPELDIQDVLDALRVPEIAYEMLKRERLRAHIRGNASAIRGAELDPSVQGLVDALLECPWNQEYLKTVGSTL